MLIIFLLYLDGFLYTRNKNEKSVSKLKRQSYSL